MITIKDLEKKYVQEKETIFGLKKINLTIPRGCIYGIIGLSGAGKSSLLRCINRLEEPTKGSIHVNGKNITTYNTIELREYRKSVGMIFQHFHLLSRKTIYQNISLPLEISGQNKTARDKRVKELLKLVGLEHKIHSYPSQLSGGEKQRVGIARALANNPNLLLCDEPTSALDPNTTQSILELLKEINQKLNITIIIITHQMEVVKEICQRVAVIDRGEIIEEGKVLDIFSRPKEKLTSTFVEDKNVKIPMHYMTKGVDEQNSKLIKIYFPPKSANKPILSQMIKSYPIQANILAGNINYIQNNGYGQLIIELTGEKEEVDSALLSLIEQNLKIEVIKNGTYNSSN